MHYLLILADKNLRPLRPRFKQLGAFFTGIGYAISENQEAEVAELCEQAGLTYYKQPLPTGHSFASLEQSYKTTFFQDKLISLEREMAKYAELEGNHYIEELRERATELKEQMKRSEQFEKALSSQGAPLRVQFLSDMPINFLLEEAPEIPRLINALEGNGQKRPFLRKGILAMLVGAGGVGKTHALAQLALSLATGYPWLDIFPIEKPGYVFLGLGENSLGDIHRLLRKVTKHFISKNQENQFVFFEEDPIEAALRRIAPMAFSGVNAAFIHQGRPTPFFDNLLASLKQSEPPEGWSCIILDPISRFIGMDAETDNAAATQFIALLEKLPLELKGNPTVIFGHHMNKGGVSGLQTDQAAARGSSAITDGVRWQVNLEKNKQEESHQEILFRHVKSNFTSILPIQTLRKDETGCLYAISEIPKAPSYKPILKRMVTLGTIGGHNDRS